MRKLILSLTLVCMMSVSALAAEWYNGIYIAPKVMYGFTTMNDMKGSYPGVSGKKSGDDSVFGGGLALGYDFDSRFEVPLRAELEYSLFSRAEDDFSKNGMNVKQKLDIQTLFANAYFDFHNQTRFTPFIGAGLGIAFIDDRGKIHYNTQRVSLGSNSETNFAWNVMAGVDFKIIESLTAGLNYRFAGLGEAETKKVNVTNGTAKTKSEDVYMHQIALSLRYTF